jgi:hypothetical protein
MKKIQVLIICLCSSLFAFSQQSYWKSVNESSVNKNLFANRYKPQAYQLFQLNETSLQSNLSSAPSERSVTANASSFILSIPNAEGQIERYRVVDAPVLDAALATRYPSIKSYAGQGIDRPASTIRFSMAGDGFHGMILSADRRTIYIDPVDRGDKYYVVFSRQDNADNLKQFNCFTPATAAPPISSNASTLRAADDGKLRTYRLALACTGEYANYFLNGTETSDAQRKTKVLAAMNTLVTRTNAIYERDFGIRMVLIANNDALIYLNAGTDPWSGEYNSKTQQTIDAVIGNAGYDIGHLVHKEASAANNNGNAGCIGCVCKAGQKGSAFTSHVAPEGDPFVVDYTTHEMGHQFGGNHTFTFRNESGTASQFEPGSGSTIMGYAGITGATDVQPHSDDYFHTRSIEQISDYIKLTNGGGACAAITVTGNTAPTANAGTDYTIPKSTPFTLTGAGTDANSEDVLTYTWEQMNAGTSSTTYPSTTATSGPLFRSRKGTTATVRTFPILSSILDGTNTNQWEKLPGVARTLNFRLTVKDNHAGGGNAQTDDMSVVVSSAAGPFAVTAPNTNVSWAGGSTQTVTWSVANSNASPVNCVNVKISLSVDGGANFSTVLLASTPNDGSETITVPAMPTTTARIKVEAVGNIFFDISNTNFTIGGAVGCTAPGGLNASAITTSGATLSWAAVSGATSYDVDYKLSTSSTWAAAVTGTTSTSVNINGLSSSSVYDWRVKTNCSGSTSAYATAQFTTAGTTTCGIPTGLTSTAITASAATVTWAAVSGAVSYDVDYKLSTSSTWVSTGAATASTSKTITGLTASATYDWRVRANCSGASSTYVSAQFTTTPPTSCVSSYDVSTNGNANGAATIPLNTDIKGLISPSNDNDYYEFVISNSGTATITLTTLPFDYDLRLYRSNGTSQLAISENGNTTSETISRNFTAGTYYVRVYGYNGANSSTNCYTLKVATGTASRSAATIAEKNTVDVYPNPVGNTLNVQIPGTKSNTDIQLFDMYGKLMMQKKSTGANTAIDVSALAAGVYMMRVGKETTIKVVKE